MAAMIKKVGVIGSGQMGNGIAHVAALAGLDVVLNDVSADRLKSGMATINGNLSRQVAKKMITEDARKKALDRIVSSETMDGLAACDLVIESAVEKEEVKRKIFHDLCAVLKPEAIVASNTSSISITRLAASTDRPERFIGIHFMNPVPLMELVELIRGIATDDATFDAAKEFVTKLGKHVAVSEDFPAFIVNRILLPMINEAIYTLYEGVGNVEAIDAAMKLGAHHPMGPLELADFIGLDTCLSIMQVLHEGLAELQVPAVPAIGQIRRGRLARPQDPPRLLRLPRRKAGPDALTSPAFVNPWRVPWLATEGRRYGYDEHGQQHPRCSGRQHAVAGCCHHHEIERRRREIHGPDAPGRGPARHVARQCRRRHRRQSQHRGVMADSVFERKPART